MPIDLRSLMGGVDNEQEEIKIPNVPTPSQPIQDKSIDLRTLLNSAPRHKVDILSETVDKPVDLRTKVSPTAGGLDLPIPQPFRSIIKTGTAGLLAGGEFVLAAASDLTGALLGTFQAAELAAVRDDVSIAEDFPTIVNGAREALGIQPDSAGGKQLTSVIMSMFEKVNEVGIAAGDKTIEATGSPALSAIARIGPEAIVMLAPFAFRGKGAATEINEVAASVAEARSNGIQLVNPAVIEKYVRDTNRLDSLRGQDRTTMTPADGVELKSLTDSVSKQGQALAATEGLDFVGVVKTNRMVRKLSEADLEGASISKVKQIIDNAKDSNKTIDIGAIEVVVRGNKTVVTKGVEEIMAAHMIGNKNIPVHTVVPIAKPKAVKAMADKVFKVNEGERVLADKIDKAVAGTVADNIRSQYDLTAPVKKRLQKLLPNGQWVATVQRYIQMHNAGTSASLFAKTYFEPVFNKVNGRELYKRNIDGKSVSVTDRIVLDEIVQSRRVQQIAKTRPNHKFSGGMTAKEHSARLNQLQKDIGAEEFNYINGVADNVFAVYKQLLDLRLSEGLITKDLHRKLIDLDYNPTQHLEFFDPVIATQGNVSVRSSGVVKFKDGNYDLTNVSARDLLSDSINRTFNIVAKNRVLSELNKAVEATGKDAEIRNHVKIIKHSNSAAPRGFEKITFFADGKKKFMALDPSLASVWKGSGELEGIRTGTAFLRAFTGVSTVKPIAVGLNFAFPLVDLPRTLIGVGFSNGRSMSGVPLFGPKSHAGRAVFGLPYTAGQMIRNMVEIAKDAKDHGSYFQELAGQNAFPRFLAEIGLEEFKSATRGITIFGKASAKAEKYLNRLGEGLAYPGIYAETLLRMAVAKQAQRRGLSIVEQAAESIRMVNFNDAGYLTARLDNYIPFFNAAFQATRTQFKGIKENPLHSAEMATSVMATTAASYWMNWLTNPDAVAQISDEDLATGFNIVFPRSMSTIDQDGALRHPYLHIPADGAAIPFVAMSAWIMRRYNEHREPSGMIMNAIGTSTFPLLNLAGAPVVSASLALFGNYDTFRGQKLYPRDVGQPWQEYYAAHESRATPQIYVDMGKMLWETGLVEKTPIQGLASPERLRKVVDSYIPNHPLSNAWNTLDASLIPEGKELYLTNHEKFAKAPIIGRMLKLTNPSTNPWADMEEAIGVEGAKRAGAKREVDAMAFEVANGRLKMSTALDAVASKFSDIDHAYKAKLIRRLYVDVTAHRVLTRIGREQRKGIPGKNWWSSLGAISNPVERARAYYKTWTVAAEDRRATMDQVMWRMSGVGDRHRIVDSDGRFTRELHELKKLHGSEFVPGILDRAMDLVSPSLEQE